MCDRKLALLSALLALVLSQAQAGSVLQGLEMDVMEAGETASQATSRIALPRAGVSTEESSPDYAGLLTEQTLIGGERSGEAAAVDDGRDAAPGSTDGPVSGVDVGEPVPGGIDSGEDPPDGGAGGEQPADGGGVEPLPGDGSISEEPVEGTLGDPVDTAPIGDLSEAQPGTDPGASASGEVPTLHSAGHPGE